MPSIPDVARDLKTTESIVRSVDLLSRYSQFELTYSYLAFPSAWQSPLHLWAAWFHRDIRPIVSAASPYCSLTTIRSTILCTDGRRSIYLIGLPLIVIGSIGLSVAHTVAAMLTWRFVQVLGAAPGLAIGGGVIGDIYPLEQRGTAMGIYFAACLLGSALAPFVSGVISNYTSWRFVQVTLAGSGLLGFLLIAVFYPETMHPGTRGIEKWRQKNGYGPDKFTLVWLNPLRVIALLRNPNLLLVSFSSFAVLLCEYRKYIKFLNSPCLC